MEEGKATTERWIIGLLTAILLTGLASWFSFGYSTASEAYVETYVDLKLGAVEENTKALKDLTNAVNKLAINQAETNTKLEMLMERQ